MKKTFYILCCSAVLWGSCKTDNYPAPKEAIKGAITDVLTGDTVWTDQGSEGIRVRLRELSWKATKVPKPFDFYCMKEGIYQNTKVFEGHYNVRVDGAFIPLVRTGPKGDTLANGDASKYIDIKGVTVCNFQVQPFLKVEWAGAPTVTNGTITASVKVTRAVSRDDFKAKIEPMGSYNDNMLNVTDIRLFVSQVPYVGYREKDDRYSQEIAYNGNEFEAKLGQPVAIVSRGTIPAGYIVFIRAAARINYRTEGHARYNYNKAVRVNIPKK